MIMKFNANNINEMDVAVIFFCIITATISAPPVLPPTLKASAMAKPIQIPAANAAKIFSLSPPVNWILKLGIKFSKMERQRDCITIFAVVITANFLFTKKKERIISGKFSANDAILCGIKPLVATLIRIASPAAPPMVKLFGVIKLYEENATRIAEMKLYTIDLMMSRILPFLVVAKLSKSAFVILGGRSSMSGVVVLFSFVSIKSKPHLIYSNVIVSYFFTLCKQLRKNNFVFL